MRTTSMLFPLLLLLVSADFSPALAVNVVHRAGIPEHRCHKLIDMKTCNLEKCIQECSEEANGVGECKLTICFCTYFCKDPPK